MSFSLGSTLILTIFGSSHGELVGATLDGLPAGISVDIEKIQKWMDLRKPSVNELTTQRKESDLVQIRSGLIEGHTDGSPLFFNIKNEDAIPGHYDDIRNMPRPGHADLTLFLKYGKYRNYSGGGFLSGRMTAPLVSAGSLCMDILDKAGITVAGWLSAIGNVRTDLAAEHALSAYDYKTRIPDHEKDLEAQELIRKLISEGDSTGGVVSIRVMSVPAGLGEPFFDSVESKLAHALFSIPAVKGIEFGSGFEMSSRKGSEVRDEIFFDGSDFRTKSNNNGGILGGITNGMPLEFNVAIKPTSSIRKEISTVNLETKKDGVLKIKGRHDPCIAIRALPVVQSVTALSIVDLILESGNPDLIRRLFPS